MNRRSCLAVAFLLCGCASNPADEWETIHPPYAVALEDQDYMEVRLSVADSSVVLRDPHVAGDSITGEWKPYYDRSVAVADIEQMEGIPYVDPAIAVVAVVAGIGAAIGLIALFAAAPDCLVFCGVE